MVTGSHGGAAHGRALDAPVAGAFFNDAGIGKDRAGVARLPILDAQDTPAAAVSHESARIGEALDAWHGGRLSVVNEAAARLGIEVGQSVGSAARMLQRVTAGMAS